MFTEPGTSEFQPEFKNKDEREQWEHEQYQIDRDWYGKKQLVHLNFTFTFLEDEQNYNGEFNPFANVSNEFVEKRERQLRRVRLKPKMTAKQQQIKREKDLWENNRLSRSGRI